MSGRATGREGGEIRMDGFGWIRMDGFGWIRMDSDGFEGEHEGHEGGARAMLFGVGGSVRKRRRATDGVRRHGIRSTTADAVMPRDITRHHRAFLRREVLGSSGPRVLERRKEGRKAGRKEGRKEGRKGGRKEGRILIENLTTPNRRLGNNNKKPSS